MLFALAYSCGKDSTFALHKMLALGHEPVCLITMFRKDQQRSWFHGADMAMLGKVGDALGIPVLCRNAPGDEYASIFEEALLSARANGAQACIFGDMDIEANRKWAEDRCKAAALESHFPLWNMTRNEVVDGLIAAGYKCVIKTINLQNGLPRDVARDLCERYLGKFFDSAFARELEKSGLDPCGENGEYHTITVDGPVFRHPILFRTGKILQMDGHATIEMDFI